jgi:hypothetical protein
MPAKWRPQDINNLMITVTACLGLLIIISIIAIVAISNRTDPKLLETLTKLATGGGVVGLGGVLVMFLRVSRRSGS